jgi:hypothetical protein
MHHGALKCKLICLVSTLQSRSQAGRYRAHRECIPATFVPAVRRLDCWSRTQNAQACVRLWAGVGHLASPTARSPCFVNSLHIQTSAPASAVLCTPSLSCAAVRRMRLVQFCGLVCLDAPTPAKLDASLLRAQPLPGSAATVLNVDTVYDAPVRLVSRPGLDRCV